MSSLTIPVQTASISISLLAAGGIATLSLFDIPQAQAQPASRTLPAIRWLFSRGSHIFPTTAFVSAAGFTYLAINALPQGRALTSILSLVSNGSKVNGYLAAAALNFGIGPFTALAMVPNNFALIEMNEKKGGARSEKSAKEGQFSAGSRSADDSVGGKGDVSQFADLSGPQSKTAQDSTTEEDEKVQAMLGKFGRQNAVRAILGSVGGIVGVVAALS